MIEATKIKIHNLQKDINWIITPELETKFQQLIEEMVKLNDVLFEEKPERWYLRSHNLDQATRAYSHLLTTNRN